MATLTVTVAGTDRSSLVCAPSAATALVFTESLRERKTLSLSFRKTDGSWWPARGQGITVEHDTEGLIFGGYITQVTRRKIPGSGATIFAECTCVSYEQIMDRRESLAYTYTDRDAGDIFEDIIVNSLTDEGFTVSAVAGPRIPLFDIQVPRPSVRRALDQLCELASNGTDIYYWDATPAKVVRFFRQDTFAAPFSLTDGNPYVLHSCSVNETNQGLVNRVFVYLGQYLLEAVAESFVGDGTTREWSLTKPCGAAPTITLNGVAQNVGVDQADTGDQYYWTLGSTQIRQDAGETVLTSGDTLEVTYQGLDKREVGPFDNSASANAEGVLQGDGTTGLYEVTIEVNTPQNIVTAAEIAQAWLDRYSTATVTFKGATYTAGLHSGQELTVNLTALGINLTMLIQGVSLTHQGGEQFLWSFTAIYGPARDDWKKGIFGKSASSSISATGSGGGAVPATSGSELLAVAITANTTIASPHTPTDGALLTVRATIDATGGYTIDWDSTFEQADWPAIPSDASTRSTVQFVGIGGKWCICSTPILGEPA